MSIQSSAVLIAAASLLGACAISFSENGYRVTDGTGGMGGADGGSCDATTWACTNDGTYCSCAFVTAADAAHLNETMVATKTCDNQKFNGVIWACWATATACNCGPATSTAPVKLADSTTTNDCCGASGACTEPPAGMKPPTTCP